MSTSPTPRDAAPTTQPAAQPALHPLVPVLTLEEKASLLSGASFWQTRPLQRVGIPAAVLSDGPHGVRRQFGSTDHLGLNDSEPATAFPTAAATGSTWDPELLEQMGRALGLEARALGVDVLLGPGVNIKRSPLCGRSFEYFSEDPLLSGVLGAAWVHGVQSQGVGASLKHFAANNQETDRLRVSVEVDERTLREIYLPAFERVVTQAQPATVMCAYNKVNGTHASQHPWLLTDVLRTGWGFQGYVVSDWGAVVDPVAAVAAGLDLEMPSSGQRSPDALVAAVRSGALEEAHVDTAVSRILTVHDRLREQRGTVTGPEGVTVDHPVDPLVDHDAHHALARRIATESSVLLANEGALLPLDPASGGAIAVIGEFARTPRYQGAGSSHINPTRLDDALSAIRAATDREVRFAAGFTLESATDTDALDDALDEGALTPEASALLAEAVLTAAGADVVLLFLGLPDAAESEGFDRTHLLLPPAQLRLVAEVAAVNPAVVVVLSNGAVISLDGITGVVPAVLETWLGGQASGSATADVLFGAAEPGGRLAETIPLALAHTPAHVNWPGSNRVVRYGEGVFVGYRWYDATEREVAFPFGFGLGYTTFSFSDLVVRVPDATTAHALVQVVVTNTGQRAGAEVVQVYVSDHEASVARPERELRAFAKVRLAPGQRRTVHFELDERAFAFWSDGRWCVEPGAFSVHVGSSSRDTPLSAVLDLAVPVTPPILDTGSTVGEWLAHPAGAAVLKAALATSDGGTSLPDDPQALMIVASVPLHTLLVFRHAREVDRPGDADQTLARLLGAVTTASAPSGQPLPA